MDSITMCDTGDRYDRVHSGPFQGYLVSEPREFIDVDGDVYVEYRVLVKHTDVCPGGNVDDSNYDNNNNHSQYETTDDERDYIVASEYEPSAATVPGDGEVDGWEGREEVEVEDGSMCSEDGSMYSDDDEDDYGSHLNHMDDWGDEPESLFDGGYEVTTSAEDADDENDDYDGHDDDHDNWTTPPPPHRSNPPHNCHWPATWDPDTREEEPLFHNLVHAMMGTNNRDPQSTNTNAAAASTTTIPPFVRCPICTTTQLSIRALPLHHPTNPTDLPDLAPGMVLLCGHMFCKPCWALHMAQYTAATTANNNNTSGGSTPADDDHENNRSPPPNPPPHPPLCCPMCRVELRHPVCGCRVGALEMPINPYDPGAREKYEQEWGRWYRFVDDEWAREYPPTLGEGGGAGDVCEECAEAWGVGG
ncbi:hypothetical protein N658DRAFT_506433 [Parathielavia hyrcaniae]|uniref:RING-type domain-containing protein n=1 Tax=Parathielavia hyrcaniae TaxID=113614 RepID=A0AAN6Q4R5_9PEZI|nr:hypothetical protein N658DRAFT_506433 [Parathielavia hyrcaniae]